MRKTILIYISFAILTFSINVRANAQMVKSINFEKGNWSEIVKKAKEENKLIFVDFYTQWCGPCLNMAEEVFILPSVYDFYNTNFVNAKIDAENGEGIDLANKYSVRSYPTYLFIDPSSMKVVHKSGSRQDAQTFIFTGESALDPNKRSFYLESYYDSKKSDLEFLKNYIQYKTSVYDRDAIAMVLSHLDSMNIKLHNAMAWDLFYNHITGFDNIFFNEVVLNYTKYASLYGKEIVDYKLAKESTYAPESVLNKLPDFSGKETNLVLCKLNSNHRAKMYEECISIIDSSIDNPLIDQDKLLNALRFVVRVRSNESYPQLWLDKCGEYMRYIAYNYSDRRDAYVHYEYALYLESLLKKLSANGVYEIPSYVIDNPTKGKSEYTMRPDKLKQKPVKK